jgi:hypothetical protein
MVETLNTGKSSNLTCCRLRRKSRGGVIRSLVISQTAGCRTAGIVCMSAGVPCSPPPLKLCVRLTTVVREGRGSWTSDHTVRA